MKNKIYIIDGKTYLSHINDEVHPVSYTHLSRLQLMDLPLPGVPNTSPLGLRDCLRSSRIMLLERALSP